jgi:hypothetical protein
MLGSSPSKVETRVRAPLGLRGFCPSGTFRAYYVPSVERWEERAGHGHLG